MLHAFDGKLPKLGDRVFIAPGAEVIGDVELGDEASVWFNAVIRGDVYYVRIGARTSIQDGTVVHVTSGRNATLVGADVTVGHRVVLHGCEVRHHALIGMGAVVMDRAVIGEYALVAAGSLVPEGMVVPSGTLAMGVPAKVRRDLTEAERAHLDHSSAVYVALAAQYLAAARPG